MMDNTEAFETGNSIESIYDHLEMYSESLDVMDNNLTLRKEVPYVLHNLDKYNFTKGSVIGKDCGFIKDGKTLTFEDYAGDIEIMSTGKAGAHVIEDGTIVGNNAKLYYGSIVGSKSLILGDSKIEGQIGNGCVVYNSHLDDNSIVGDGASLINSYLGGDGGSSAVGKNSSIKNTRIRSHCAVGNGVNIKGAVVSAFSMICDNSKITGSASYDRFSTTKDFAFFREGSNVNVREGYEYADVNSTLRNKESNGFLNLRFIIQQMRNQDVSLTSESLGISKDSIVKVVKNEKVGTIVQK